MDVAGYRMSERLGKLALRSWHLASAHMPSFFQENGFPVRIDGYDDLLLLLDTMHENRFGKFVEEMNGLSEDDIGELVHALVGFARFYLQHFPGNRVPMPLSTMIAQFAIARKLRGIENRRRVLEIGPGCGYLSFFLANDPEIERYDSTESTESFYLLQGLVNRFVYGESFAEHAHIDARSLGLGGFGALEERAANKKIFESYERSGSLEIERPLRAEHFPWWKLGSIMERRYDIVTSNANFTEFSEPALDHYAKLISTVLEPHGVLFAQCQGGGHTQIKHVLMTFLNNRLFPVVLAPGDLRDLKVEKRFALTNYLFIRDDHPLFSKYAKPLEIPLIDTGEPLVRSVFSLDEPAGRKVSDADILSLVKAQLAERLGGTVRD